MIQVKSEEGATKLGIIGESVMSLIELPVTFVADWKTHYADTRKRMAAVPAVADTPIIASRAHKRMVLENARRAREEETDRKRRQTFVDALEKAMATKAALAAKYAFESANTKLTIRQIQKEVCKRTGVSMGELLGPQRMVQIVRPRHVAMYLAKKLMGQSLPVIGRSFGNKDHTTVLNACRRIEQLRAADSKLDQLITELEADLRQEVADNA